MATDSKLSLDENAELRGEAEAVAETYVLHSHDVMETLGSRLNFFLHNWKAQQMCDANPTDHVGLFEHLQLENVSYKELLFQSDRLHGLIRNGNCDPIVAKEVMVYDTYLTLAEDAHLEDLSQRWLFLPDSYRDPETLRIEMRCYFRTVKPSSVRNEIAHFFSRTVESDRRQGPNGFAFWDLKDSPTPRAREPDVKRRLLNLIDELSQFDKLPDSVKQFVSKFPTCFGMQLGFLRSVLEGSGKKSKPAYHGDEDAAQCKAPPQGSGMTYASVLKN